MTQFALAITKDDSPSLVSVERLRDDFLMQIAKKLFPDTPVSEIFSLDQDGKNIDQLMLDAQKTAGSLQFEKTELCQTIRRIVPTVEELVFWYGSDYDDLDCVYDVSILISKLREATSESVCEAYVHYKQLRSDR
jgi:hypothetical protein